MAYDHPWTGVGLDAFGTAYPHYRIPEYWGLEWGGLPEKAHNEAIQILATQGVPGAMAALLVVVLAAVAIRRRLGRGDAPAHAGAIATAATLVAFVVQGLMGFTVVALGSLAAAMAGWITSVPSSGKSDRPGQPRRGHSTAALVPALRHGTKGTCSLRSDGRPVRHRRARSARGREGARWRRSRFHRRAGHRRAPSAGPCPWARPCSSRAIAASG